METIAFGVTTIFENTRTFGEIKADGSHLNITGANVYKVTSDFFIHDIRQYFTIHKQSNRRIS